MELEPEKKMKICLIYAILLSALPAWADGRLVFSCDFTNGFLPQVCIQPCDIFPKGVRIVDTEVGKALRFGKGKDGSISCLTYRLKSSVNPEKLPEDELPFPMRFGRLEFRFRPVDWSLGDPPFNMMLKLEGPLRTNLHLTYTRPHSTGTASLQAAYGQYQNPAVGKGELPVIFPLVKLDGSRKWHTAVFEWRPDMVKLTVDGESVILATKNLAYPHSKFYAGELQIGSPFAALLRGESEIADIRIYSTMPERKSAALPERFPELIANIMKAPLIDGEISETEWGNVSRYTGFSKLPGGAVGHHQPVVRIGYDDQAVYIALKSPGHKRPPVAEKDRRDGNLWEDDGVEFYVSPDQRKKEEYYQFIVNYRGTVFDQHFRAGASPAECRSWNSSGIRAASKTAGDTWSMEIAIPFADLGETMPAAGNCWNFNLCETLQGIGFFSMSPVANSFAEPGKFGILRFAGKNAPVIDFSSLGGLSGGVAEFRCGIKGGSPAQLEVNAMRYDETAQTEFPLFGETAAVSAEPRICFRAGEDKLGKTGTLYANILHRGTRLYAGRFSYEAQRAAEVETMRRVVIQGKNFLKVSTAHNPDDSGRLRLTVMNKSGKPAVTKTVPVTDMKQDTLLPLSGLTEGDYLLFLELLDRNGHVYRKSEARAFTVYGAATPWQGCELVKTDHVPAPWTPLKVTEKDGRLSVSCWNRTYVFGPRSLFAEQIVSGGMNCLASPVRLDAGREKKNLELRNVAVKAVAVSERRAVIESTGVLKGQGTVKVRAEIDYDGFIWYQMELASAENMSFDRLAVTLEMPRNCSTLLNSGDRSLRNTGRTPVKWSKMLDDTFGPFWIGSEKGGLSFGIESAENWRNRDPGSQAVVRRDAGNAEISIQFIDRPAKMAKNLSYGFYIHPTPVRPRPENYRKVRAQYWFAHNRDQLAGKGYPSNLSWWMSSFTFQGYPEWVTDRTEIAEMDRKRANFGYLARDYNHYDTLTKERCRSGWYAAYSSIGRNAPEVIWNGEMWRAGSQDKLYGNTLYDYSMDMIEVCKTKDYSDFYLWRFDKSRKEHPRVDGLYFDLMFWPACTRADHGHGYTDENGKRKPTYAIREHRKWLERLYLYCRERADGAPLIMHLSGATSRVAGFSYADYFLDGELWQEKLVSDRSYKAMTLDCLRAEILPHIWGPGLIWCSQLYRIAPFVPAGQRKTWKLEPWAERHLAGMLLLHDVIPDRTSQNDTAWKIWLALDRFRLSDKDLFLPYWETCGISGNADGVNTAVTAYLNAGEKRMLMVLFNNRDTEHRFRLVPDIRRLFGASGSVEGKDLETGAELFRGQGEFTLDVPKRDFRLIELKFRE